MRRGEVLAASSCCEADYPDTPVRAITHPVPCRNDTEAVPEGSPGIRPRGDEVLRLARHRQRHHLPQSPAAPHLRPVLQNRLRLTAARPCVVADDQRMNPLVIDVVAI